MDDVLSDLFRLIKLKSCVYFLRDFWSPWGMQIGGTGFAQFHVVTRGQCVVEAAGTCRDVVAGDVLLFPRGDAHVLADRPGRAATPGAAVMASLRSESPCFAAGARPTELICGHFEYRGEVGHPLIAQLPGMVHVPAFDSLSPGAIDSILPLLIREMKSAGPGGTSVVERLAEVLLVQVLRLHYQANPQPKGFWAGLADPKLARAIQAVHSGCGDRLTLEGLAAAAGMSRSAFALRFKDTVGLSPIDYLTKWRMLKAGELLQRGELSLAGVAREVGYDSEISFGRAFKREFALSPGEYRRRAGPSQPLEQTAAAGS